MRLTVFLGGLLTILILLVGVLSWFSLDFSLRASALLGTKYDSVLTIAVLFGMVLALVAGMSFYVYTAVIKPLMVLRNKVSLVAQGDFDVHVRQDSTNVELGDLSASFQTMTENLRVMMDSKDRINAELQESESRFREMFFRSPVSVQLVDYQGYTLKVNDAFFTLFNAIPPEGYSVFEDPLVKRQGLDMLWEKVRSGEAVRFPDICYNPRELHPELPDRPLWLQMTVFSLSASKEEEAQFVLMHEDITPRKKAEASIEYLSFHDHLTGLYNRRFFDEELSLLDVPRNLPLSMTLLDVNGLKLTNDAFGHQAGDQMLREVAWVLREKCGSHEIAARVGGDEFLILSPRTGAGEARRRAEEIAAALGEVRGVSGYISVAWGCGTKNWPEENMEDVYKRAENKMYRDKIHEREEFRGDALTFITKTLYERIPREQRHAERVGAFSGLVGQALGLSSWEVKELAAVGKFHDIGKVAVSASILDKPGPLDPEEWEEVKLHSEISYKILSSVNAYASLAEVVLAHHERFDGKGYPKGLRGEAIPLGARIIAVVEAFDAMTCGRPYKKTFSPAAAVEELRRCAGTQFDPKVVQVFSNLLDSGDICPFLGERGAHEAS